MPELLFLFTMAVYFRKALNTWFTVGVLAKKDIGANPAGVILFAELRKIKVTDIHIHTHTNTLQFQLIH